MIFCIGFNGGCVIFGDGKNGLMIACCKEWQAIFAHSIKLRAFSILSTTNTCNFSLNFLAKYLLYSSAASASVKIGSVLFPLPLSTANNFLAL
jgi:hypothetical protein